MMPALPSGGPETSWRRAYCTKCANDQYRACVKVNVLVRVLDRIRASEAGNIALGMVCNWLVNGTDAKGSRFAKTTQRICLI